MKRKLATVVSIFILAFLLVSCTTSVEVIDTPTAEVIDDVVETETAKVTISSVEDYLTLSQLSAAIRNSDIEVGDEYGMAVDQRFHTIHVEVVGMSCVLCHVMDAPEEVAPAAEGAPGVVDRRVCLGCHANGPALALYDLKE